MQVEIDESKPNENRIFNSGNYAFALGLVESQCKMFAYYPGTPISEIYEHLDDMKEEKKLDLILDNSLNETVAFSTALGACWSGYRSAVAFKHLGMNLISDVLHTAMYSGLDGSRAGMVIICGGDPNCISSTNSQDNRMFSLHTKLPILEPWDIDSCRYLISVGFELSESINLPVMIYTSTRLCHSSGFIYPDIEYSSLQIKKPNINANNTEGKFIKDPNRFWNAIHWALANQTRLNQTIKSIKDNPIEALYLIHENKEIELDKAIAFITSGLITDYVREFIKITQKNHPILQLILTFPISEKNINGFIEKYRPSTVIIFEELEPYLEIHVKNALYGIKNPPKIIGKDYFPLEKELGIEHLYLLFRERFSLPKLDKFELSEGIKGLIQNLPIREPTFCPGCAHRNTFYSLRKAVDVYFKDTNIEIIFGGDIGCYTLGMSYPYNVIDWLVCMGAGIGISNGVARMIDQKKQHIVAMIGDSTFFHSGIQPLLNLAKDSVDITILLLDNYTTAMTGHQASPSSPQFMQDHPQKTISISDMIKTYQLESITYLDGYNTKSMQNSFYNAFAKKGINLIIVSAECALNKSHRLKDEDKSMKPSREFTIAETCVKCNECFEKLGCTAIEMVNDKLEIQEDRCMAEFCDVCYNVCPNHAIFKTVINPHLESQKIESNQKSEDKKG